MAFEISDEKILNKMQKLFFILKTEGSLNVNIL